MAIPSLAMIPSGYKDGKVYSVLPSNGDGDFTFSRGSNATRVNKDGLIETVTGDTPRLDHSDSSCPSLLLEPQRTNSITYSNDFSQSIYGKINLTITANQGISPDGTQNANLLVPNAAIGNRYLSNGSASDLKTNTVFLKKKELRYVNVGNSSSVVVVDLENGTISSNSVSANRFTIENYGNGWYRVSCYNTSSTNYQIQIFFGVDGSGSNIATNGTDGVYIYGFEIQNGSYATSYIPTNGATATRLAEVCTGAGTSDTFNDSEGVLMAEISALSDDNSVRYISLNDGSASNRIRFGYTTPTNSFRLLVVSTGSSQVDLTEELSSITLFNKLAIKYKENDFAIWSNGFKIAVDTSGITPSNLSQLDFDNAAGTDNFYANTKQIQYFDSALTDSE